MFSRRLLWPRPSPWRGSRRSRMPLQAPGPAGQLELDLHALVRPGRRGRQARSVWASHLSAARDPAPFTSAPARPMAAAPVKPAIRCQNSPENARPSPSIRSTRRKYQSRLPWTARGPMHWGSSLCGLLTRGLTGKRLEPFRRAGPQQLAPARLGIEPALEVARRQDHRHAVVHRGDQRIRRAVMMVHERSTAPPGCGQRSQRPANAKGAGPCAAPGAVVAPCRPCATRRSRRPAPGSAGADRPRGTPAWAPRSRRGR